MVRTLACLHTTVVNTSGEERIFGFLPPYGRKLAVDGEFTELGTLMDWIQPRGGMAPGPENQIAALKRAIADENLEIKSTPALAVYDATAEETVLVGADDSLLDLTTPCWID